jgi:hypothetical protein
MVKMIKGNNNLIYITCYEYFFEDIRNILGTDYERTKDMIIKALGKYKRNKKYTIKEIELIKKCYDNFKVHNENEQIKILLNKEEEVMNVGEKNQMEFGENV